MDFGKFKSIVAEPPAGAGRAASGKSPLQANVLESVKDGEWHGYMEVPTTIAGKKKRRGTNEEYEIREFEVLCDELKRAARQLEVGLQLRIAMSDDGKFANVYFLAGEKRKYEKRKEGDGNAESPTQTASGEGNGASQTAQSGKGK